MRHIPNIESHTTALAVARMFPEARWSYLRSALRASAILASGDEDYLNRMDNRAYHTRIRDLNLDLYRKAVAR